MSIKKFILLSGVMAAAMIMHGVNVLYPADPPAPPWIDNFDHNYTNTWAYYNLIRNPGTNRCWTGSYSGGGSTGGYAVHDNGAMKVGIANNPGWFGFYSDFHTNSYAPGNEIGLNVTSFTAVTFRIKGSMSNNPPGGGIRVSLRKPNVVPGSEPKVNITNYLSGGISTNWQTVVASFRDFGAPVASLEAFSLPFENSSGNPCQGVIWIDDLKFLPDVPTNVLKISGMGSYNQNYSADTDNAYLEGALVRVWIREMNNTTGATGFIDISPFSRTGVTNTNMIEAGSGQYDFIWNTTGLSNGSYSLETRLKKTGMSNDMNGYNDSGTDLVVRVTNGLKISAISSSAGDDADGSYTVSDKIEIRIREKNYATGCQAYITLYAAGRTNVNKALMSGLAGGEYAYVWDTKGLPAGTYFAETMITNSSRPGHQPDRDGYDDSGPDLLLALAEELSPKDKALVLWNNYPKPGEAVKIFMNSPDPAGQASSMVSIRVYTLSGTLITEILNVPYSQVPRPVLWYGDRNGKTLPNGVYAIHVKGAGIDAYKRVYLFR